MGRKVQKLIKVLFPYVVLCGKKWDRITAMRWEKSPKISKRCASPIRYLRLESSKSVGFEADEAATDISALQLLGVIAEPFYNYICIGT